MEYKHKNIVDAFLENEIHLLIQGCNCFCSFGRGLAEEILNRIPEAYEADVITDTGNIDKLGTYSFYKMDEKRFVINAYTQYHWIKRKNHEPKVKKGRGFVLANYEAIRLSLRQIANSFNNDLSIGLPKIGGGWANGDWNIIANIIQEELIDKGYSVVIYVIDESEIPKKEDT